MTIYVKSCTHIYSLAVHHCRLKHITNGYWVVVQEFTHKATVKEIKRFINVTTNLGRGKAICVLLK